jgi:hypothetical protein
VIYARDQDHVRELCPDVNFVGAAIACAIRGEESCFVAIAPDADIAAAGATHWLVMRHEMGHCNGWRGHSGARSRLAELPFASDNVVDTVSQFDNFARNAVGKTVAQVANTLAKSDWTAAKFVLAAKGIGRASDDQVNKEILSNPDTARSLARAAGIGTDLSDEQWREAHAIAFQASRARQNAAIAGASQSVPDPGQAAPRPQQAQPTASRATTDVVCAVVLNTPDGFLAVRERPGTQFRMTDKLRPGQAVNISSEDCVWHSNGNVTCNKWIWVSGSDRTPASGWVRSKYLQAHPDC